MERYEKNIKKYYVYKFLSSFFLFSPIIILFFLEYLTYTEFGIVIAVGLITNILFEIPSGVWADNFGRKNIVSIGVFFVALELFVIGASKEFISFIIAAIMGGIGAALTSGADTSLLYESIIKGNLRHKRKKIYGYVRANRYWAIVIASIIGAPIYASHPSWPFFISGTIILCAGIIFLSMYEDVKRKKTSIKEQTEHIIDSFKIIKNNQHIIWILQFSVLSAIMITVFHDMMRSPYYEMIGFSIAILGVITAIVTTIRSVFSVYAENIENYLGEKNTLIIVLITPIIAFPLLAIINNKFALLVTIIFYAVWSILEVISETMIHDSIQNNNRATIFSISTFLLSINIAFFSIIFGKIIDVAGMNAAFYTMGVLSAIIFLIIHFHPKTRTR